MELNTGILLKFNCLDILGNRSYLYTSHTDYGMDRAVTQYNGKKYNNRYAPFLAMFQLFCQEKYMHLTMRRNILMYSEK